MFFYRLDIAYNGLAYQGWQTQPHHQTIQDTLDQALLGLGFLRPSVAAGRTDAGVHALKQVVRISGPQAWDPAALVRAVNAKLPSAIRVQAARPVEESFHPLKNEGKEYRYLWAKEVLPFGQGLMTAYDFPLDLALMAQAARCLLGKHDFAPFACRGTPVKSTIREIFAVQIQSKTTPLPWITGEYYQFSVVGSGFLKQMVRLIMGGLFNVGRGKVSLAQWQAALAGDCTPPPATELDDGANSAASSPLFSPKITTWPYPRLGPVAPPDGLYLADVFFTPAERQQRIIQMADPPSL